MGFADERFVSLAGSLVSGRLSRRDLLKRSAILGLAVPVSGALLSACGDDDDDEPDAPAADPDDDDDDDHDDAADDSDPDDDEDPDDDDSDDTDDHEGEGVYGGSLNDAIPGELPSHDPHTTTAAVANHVLSHMYEYLFTYDADMEVQPDLAESIDVADDGLSVTLKIREGIEFHNGEPLTADDVIASIERWGELSARAGIIPEVATLTAADDHTIEWELTDPIGPLQHMLARQNQGCTIHPSSVIDEVGTSVIEDTEYYIGTGPYQFDDYQPDRHFKVVRYDNYVSHPGETSGYYGQKHLYLDEIYFIPVPDEASRIAGLQAGDYHYVSTLHADNFERLDDDPNVVPRQLPPQGWAVFVLNMREGLMTDQTLRSAVQATFCSEPMLIAAYGSDWYALDPSVMVGAPAWYSTRGEEYYNQCDPDKGWELAEEAGYDGEPIRWVVTQEYQEHFDYTAVGAQQLEDAGFDIDLQIYDWATLTEIRNTPGDYELATTGHTFRPEPLALTFVPGPEHDGWWDTPDKNALSEELQRESEHEARFAIWEDIQQLFYEEVPRIKIGDRIQMHAMSANLRGWTETVHLQVSHVNHWLEG